MNNYGINERNPLIGEHPETGSYCLYWNDPQLKRITRLRLLSDPGLDFWDVSYCYGEDQNGEPCRVALPFSQLRRKTARQTPYGEWRSINAPSIFKQLVEFAKEDGLYLKRIYDDSALSYLV